MSSPHPGSVPPGLGSTAAPGKQGLPSSPSLLPQHHGATLELGPGAATTINQPGGPGHLVPPPRSPNGWDMQWWEGTAGSLHPSIPARQARAEVSPCAG